MGGYITHENRSVRAARAASRRLLLVALQLEVPAWRRQRPALMTCEKAIRPKVRNNIECFQYISVFLR